MYGYVYLKVPVGLWALICICFCPRLLASPAEEGKLSTSEVLLCRPAQLTAAPAPAMKWLFHALLCMASKSALPPVFICSHLCLPGPRISDQRNGGLPLGSAFAQTDLQVSWGGPLQGSWPLASGFRALPPSFSLHSASPHSVTSSVLCPVSSQSAEPSDILCYPEEGSLLLDQLQLLGVGRT